MMISLVELTRGVEWVWLVWLVAIAVLAKMVARSLRHWRRPRWTELARGEDGVSYSLSYVLVLPFFFLFVCIVFETTWLLLAKVGTLYAAHAGARSAVVWSSAQPSNLQTPRINQSVWTAMTPFATGEPSWQGPQGDAVAQSIEYAAAYGLYSRASGDPNANAPSATMIKRYLNAASRTTWRADPPLGQARAGGSQTVTVSYRAPVHIPGAARIFGNGREYPPIVSSATLPSEAPASEDGTLGIEYQSR